MVRKSLNTMPVLVNLRRIKTLVFALLLVFFLCLQVPLALSSKAAGSPNFSTINNGVVEVGVDLNGGGSIGYVASAQTHGNIVNIHDLGRYIGQSYYSGPKPFGNPSSNWSDWPWNPVSGGDVYGNTSQVIDVQNDGQTIYVKSVPKQWALDGVSSQCTFETWITLENNAVSVSNRLTNYRSDNTQYRAFSQELPAVYTTGRLWRLFSYQGAQPFTGDVLSQIQASNSTQWAQVLATEGWMAAVDNTGWGLGIYHPGQNRFLGGFVSSGWQPGTGGPQDAPTSYMAPVGIEVLDHNISYSYQYYLVLGTLSEIRNFVYSQEPNALPNYVFTSDRQHFYYNNASDGGWPIQGHLHVNLNQNNAQVIGPYCSWRAEQVPNLYIMAAYNLSAATTRRQKTSSIVKGQIQLQYWGSSNFAAPVDFNFIADGKPHLYAINLTKSPNHHGLVTRLAFNPIVNGANEPGDSVDISYISANPGFGINSSRLAQGLQHAKPAPAPRHR